MSGNLCRCTGYQNIVDGDEARRRTAAGWRDDTRVSVRRSNATRTKTLHRAGAVHRHVELPGMLHAAFLRSQVAHARIKSIDVSEALKRPGVVAVYTAEDLGRYWKPGPLLVPPPPIPGSVFNTRTHVPLAKDNIRRAGEPIAIVVAESRYIAEDALDESR